MWQYRINKKRVRKPKYLLQKNLISTKLVRILDHNRGGN
jgi:hypothetical protein